MIHGGYFLIIRDHERLVRYGERIESKTYFSVAVPANYWNGLPREIALVSLNGEAVNHICLVEKKRRVATYERQLRFSRFFSFDEPIPFELLQTRIDNSMQRFWESVVTTPEGGWVTSATWREVIRVVSDLRPEVIPIIDQLESLRETFTGIHDKTVIDVLAEEKDAYTSILRFAGFENIAKSSVTAWLPVEQPDAAPLSFVASINSTKSVTITEDQAIEYDATRFGDWKQLKQYVTGERIFHKDDETLLVRNVNRQSLEATLGVDLVYYNCNYRAFVLVQYKRMVRENGEHRYRPDHQFTEEIKRMRDFESETSSLIGPPTILTEYRLNGGAFYFKFHKDEIFDPANASLIQGMHVPLEYWGLFENSLQALGPRGGLFVSYDNMGRYLNNSDFEALVSKGLIGSLGMITEILLQIVQPPALELNHSVTVGIKV